MNLNYPKPNKPHIRIRWRTGKAQVYYNATVMDTTKLVRNLDHAWKWLGTKGFSPSHSFESYMHPEGVLITNFLIPPGSKASQELQAKLKANRGAK